MSSGTRDPIELKPARSHEDAFFIIPEEKSVLDSILFIQTSVDILTKFIPFFCSVGLDLSKGKQIEVMAILDSVNKFLLGDSVQDIFTVGDERMNSVYSKEENDAI